MRHHSMTARGLDLNRPNHQNAMVIAQAAAAHAASQQSQGQYGSPGCVYIIALCVHMQLCFNTLF